MEDLEIPSGDEFLGKGTNSADDLHFFFPFVVSLAQ